MRTHFHGKWKVKLVQQPDFGDSHPAMNFKWCWKRFLFYYLGLLTGVLVIKDIPAENPSSLFSDLGGRCVMRAECREVSFWTASFCPLTLALLHNVRSQIPPDGRCDWKPSSPRVQEPQEAWSSHQPAAVSGEGGCQCLMEAPLFLAFPTAGWCGRPAPSSEYITFVPGVFNAFSMAFSLISAWSKSWLCIIMDWSPLTTLIRIIIQLLRIQWTWAPLRGVYRTIITPRQWNA